jgi:TRAP-type C4-dicarboxylate transport system substrate-binding protein
MALGSAAATVGTLAMPNLSRAQTTVWRFQSSWPQKDIFHEIAQDYVRRVNSMAGSRLKLELLPAGAVVGAFQIQDAVHSGALEGGHAAVAYWYGKHKAFSLFGTSPPWGWEANMLLGWFYYGGGEALYRELVNDMIKVNVISFLSGPQPTQPLGWFKKEIHTAEDLKGLKYRTIGLAADLFAEMEAAVTILPGGDIVPAMDRGLLDGAEFNNPSSDRMLGFPDVAKVYMLQSWHQRTETFEIYGATGAEMWSPYFLGLLAEAQGRAGHSEAGLRAAADALERAGRTGVRWIEADLHRLRGELLLIHSKRYEAEAAETCFHRALEVASEQSALMWELRAAMSLGRLRRDQRGRRREARDRIAAIQGRFTEGFDAPDLRDAKALLDELR